MEFDWRAGIERLPAVQTILRRRYDKQFATQGYGWFRGVFASFAQANQSAPANKPLGFDHDAYATEFESRLSRVFSFDYPPLFWLEKLLKPGMTLFDFGGHRGTHFYAYSHYLDFPQNFKWLVCDLPTVVASGQQLAERMKRSDIGFTTSFLDASGTSILLAAGSLQYVESPAFADSLAALSQRPQHLLLNKIPLYSGPRYVTLQNGGVAFHPQYVFNRTEFIESIVSVGYELIDQWEVPSHPGRIPFHPEASFPCHSGLYFKSCA